MNKALLAVSVAGALAYNVPIMTTKAISIPDTQTYTDEIQPRTAGLIYQYNISAATDNGQLVISGHTRSSRSMKSIGFTNIEVQYSSDCQNWYKEKNLSNMLNSNSRSYNINDYAVNVNGGYYYRVSCTHYAKENSSSSQSVSNTSNSVWIN